jgi:hypothetical protein
LHAGDSLDLADEVAKHAVAACRLIPGLAQIDPHEQQSFSGKAQVCPLQVIDRSRQQAGANQKGQRQRQLQAHQQPARPKLAKRADGPATLFLEACTGISSGDLQGRKHAEQQRRGKRHVQDEGEDQRVQREADFETRI